MTGHQYHGLVILFALLCIVLAVINVILVGEYISIHNAYQNALQANAKWSANNNAKSPRHTRSEVEFLIPNHAQHVANAHTPRLLMQERQQGFRRGNLGQPKLPKFGQTSSPSWHRDEAGDTPSQHRMPAGHTVWRNETTSRCGTRCAHCAESSTWRKTSGQNYSS